MPSALKSFTGDHKDNFAMSVNVLREVFAITPKALNVRLKTDPFLNL